MQIRLWRKAEIPDRKKLNALRAAMKEEYFLTAAYLTLLQLPHGACRARIQAILAGLRDEIASVSGRTPEDVQNEFEDRAVALQAERIADMGLPGAEKGLFLP